MTQLSSNMKFASALSQASDSGEAADQVCAALAGTLGHQADLVMVFMSAHHRDQWPVIKDRICAALSPGQLLGVTCEGVIGVGVEVEGTAGLSVLAARLPGVRLQSFAMSHREFPASLDSVESLRRAIEPDANAPVPKAMILLADPFSTPMVKLLELLEHAFPGLPGAGVAGGMASSGRNSGENRLMVNDQVMDNGLIGLTFSGPLRVDFVVSQGCRPIGKPFVITKAQRHIVMELSGRKALDALQSMAQRLSEQDRELIHSHGLMVGRVIDEYKERFGQGDFLIRGVLGVDDEAGYVAIADPQIRVGQTIQFHVRDKKTAAEDFALLLEGQKLYTPAQGALMFTCNGRGRRLFEYDHADAQAVREAMGEVPLAGFFAAGELGPIGRKNFIHGHTVSLMLFRPEEADH